MDSFHSDAQLVGTSMWGRTNVQRRSNPPARSPDLGATFMTTSASSSGSPHESIHTLSPEFVRVSRVDDAVEQAQELIASTNDATRKHLDARTWMPSLEHQELAAPERLALKKIDSTDMSSLSASMLAALQTDLSIQRKMHEKLTVEFVAAQRDLRHKSAEWVPPNRFYRCVEEVVEPLWKAHSDVLSQCSTNREEHAELSAKATMFISEQEAHSLALRDLHETTCELRAASARPMAAAQRWTSPEPWRRELEVLRNEQQSALADQARQLQKEFETAHRAELLADMAMNRVAKLEKSLSDMYDCQNVQDIGRRMQSLEAEGSGEGARSQDLSASAQTDSERIAQVACNLDDLASAVSYQTEKLCKVVNTGAAQSGQLLAQSRELSCGLEEECEAYRTGLDDLRSGLQDSLIGMDALEKKCMLVISQQCDAWIHELASQREVLTRTAASVGAAHEECKRLGGSFEVLAGQVEGLHHQLCECCSELAQRWEGEAEAREGADVKLRFELTNAMSVVKDQFAEWMEMVRKLQDDVVGLTKVATADQVSLSPEITQRQSEFHSLVELARITFEDAARQTPSREYLGPDLLDAPQSPMDSPGTNFDSAQYCSKGAADTNAVSRLVVDVLGCVSHISKSCIHECGKHRIEMNTVRDLSDALQQELRDACKSMQKEVSELRLQRTMNSSSDFDWTQQASMIHKEFDMALAAFHTHEEGRTKELADTVYNLSGRVLQLECCPPHRSQEYDEDKVRARRALLQAVDTIEAAAQRVASEVSPQK